MKWQPLTKNSTYDLVPKPNDIDVITCKWVCKLKKAANGTIARHKARLVAHGFSQKYGLDYEQVFSPVAKMVTIRTIISLAANKDWTLWKFDVKNAFLYGELDHDIFMEESNHKGLCWRNSLIMYVNLRRLFIASNKHLELEDC